MEISFAVLGALQVTVNGADLSLDSAMLRGVLAVLLLAHGQRITTGRLAQALWPTPPKSAASNLRSYVARLRATLRAGSPQLAARLVTLPNGGYIFPITTGELDARVFTDLARRGQAHLLAGEHAAAATLLRDALALWRGPAGQDVAAAGTLTQQLDHLDEQRIVATEDFLDTRLALGATAGLVPEARALVLEHPLRDRPWEQLMRALYLAGDPAGALDAYQKARQSFGEALGIEPSSRLERIQRAILQRDEAMRRVRADSATTGFGVLRDVS